jgi:hypothetical protein
LVLISIFIVSISIPQPYSSKITIPKLSLDDINKAAKESREEVEKFLKTETDLITRGLFTLKLDKFSQETNQFLC